MGLENDNLVVYEEDAWDKKIVLLINFSTSFYKKISSYYIIW